MGHMIPDRDLIKALEQRAAWGLPQISEEFKIHPELATGQHPQYALVACSDSRIKPDVIFNAHLGEAFKFRTLGNSMEDPCDHSRLSVHAEDFLTYANFLAIPSLVILGHSACGCISNACRCAALPPLAADADRSSQILRRMGDRKRFAVDMVPENQGQLFLKEHDLPNNLSVEAARLKAIEVAHAIYMARLSRDFLASIASTMRVIVAHFDIATCSLYFSLDGGKFQGFTPAMTPIMQSQNDRKVAG